MKIPASTLPFLLFLSAFQSVSLATATKTLKPPPLPVDVVHEFPSGTWVENLAVRSCGFILVTLVTSPDIYQIDPSQKTAPILVHSFTAYQSLVGIAELYPDIFYVVAGNTTFLAGNTSAPIAWAIYELDITKGPTAAKTAKIADFPNAQILNGVTALSKEAGTILVADTGTGVAYRLDVRTGKADVVIDDPTMKEGPVSPFRIGVNGLKMRNGELYFTNTEQGLLVRIPIKANGVAAGPPVVLSRDVLGADDFTLDPVGNAFITVYPENNLAFVDSNGGKKTILAGAPLQEPWVLAGPTAVQFGRLSGDRKSLYITTSAGLAFGVNNATLGGTLSRVDLKGTGYYNKDY